jgi:cytochrome c-type biogenesis protein CcmH/NrfG
VVSSWAGAKGGLGALPLARKAKALYEDAIRIRPEALQGSALNSLGVLYYRVPGWPVGFGDRERARQLLKQALEVDPAGIDPNYFYADYLVETGHAADAVPYLERALKAPPRPGREIADAGRRDEATQLLAKARGTAR